LIQSFAMRKLTRDGHNYHFDAHNVFSIQENTSHNQEATLSKSSPLVEEPS